MSTKVLVFNNTSLEDLNDIEVGLAGSAYDIVVRSRSISEISRVVSSDDIEIVVALIDKDFDKIFACIQQLNKFNPVPFVVFTYVDDKAVIRSAIKAGVSAYIVDGLEVERVLSILETAQIRFQEQQAVKNELEQVKESLSDRKVIEKAKGLLMQRASLGEDEAYKTMRKMAMDKNMKIADLARGVVSAAELLI